MQRFPSLRTAFAPLTLLCAGILLAGCGGSDGGDDGALDPTRATQVRFMNLSQSAMTTDFYLDGDLIKNSAYYASTSTYSKVSSGNHRFGVTDEASESEVQYEEADSIPYDTLTVFCVDDKNTITPIVAKDNQSYPIVDDLSILRIVQASPTTGPVDVSIAPVNTDLDTEEPDLQDVTFKTVTKYTPFPAGYYQVRITPANSKTVLLELPSIRLHSGGMRTVFLYGNQTTDFPLKAGFMTDRDTSF